MYCDIINVSNSFKKRQFEIVAGTTQTVTSLLESKWPFLLNYY